MEKKMRQIEFDLERALRIQNGEEKGRVITKTGHNVRIVCTDVKGNYPIIGIVASDDLQNELVLSYTREGNYNANETNCRDLVLEIPLKQKRFNLKPFDKVLVRDCETEKWRINIFSHYHQTDREKQVAVCLSDAWIECIPYNDDTKHLVGTTDPFKY